MKYNRIISRLFLASMLLSATGCVDDKSNKDFTPINQIEISGLKVSYEANLGGRLTIPVTVNSTDNDLSYVWYLYADQTGSRRDTLATTKDLDVVISGSHANPGTTYNLIYRVTDNKTGVFKSVAMKFTANSEYTKGLMALCESSGNVQLSMIYDDKSVKSNLYRLNNPGEELSGVYHSIYFANPSTFNPAMKQLILMADDANGGVVLDPVTLGKLYTVREMFDYPISETTLNVRDYSGRVGMIDYVTLNGKLCKRTVNMNVLLFQSNPLVVSNSSSDFSIAGYISMENEPIVYDDKNGRILAHAPWNQGTLLRVTSSDPTTPFDANNVGNYEFLSAGQISAQNYWMLLRNRSTHDFVLFKFKLEKKAIGRSTVLVFTPLLKKTITNAQASHLNDQTMFIAYNDLQNSCFYATGNKLYLLNISMIESGTEQLAEKELVAPSSITITGCKYESLKIAEPTAENPDNTRESRQIRLMVQDNTLSQQKGGVIYYEISTTSGVALTEIFRKTGGFCDRIIDIAEKSN